MRVPCAQLVASLELKGVHVAHPASARLFVRAVREGEPPQPVMQTEVGLPLLFEQGLAMAWEAPDAGEPSLCVQASLCAATRRSACAHCAAAVLRAALLCA